MRRKMKIGCIVIGDKMTYTKKSLAEQEELKLDEAQSNERWDRPVDENVLKMVRERVGGAVPRDAEIFYRHVTTENEILDMDEADAYVVIPFGKVDDFKCLGHATNDVVFAALYAKNKPVVFSIFPYEEIWSYGAVWHVYFLRDYRKLDAYMNLPNQAFVSKDPEDLKKILAALNVKYKVTNSTALFVGEPMYEPFHSWNWGYEMVRAIQAKFGIKYKQVSAEKFLKLFKAYDKEVSQDEIKDILKYDRTDGMDLTGPVKVYHLLRDLIDENDADVFTINCLWSVCHTAINATSCYALGRLNEEGTISACEGDTTSLLDMMITAYAADGPAFMCNPYLFPEDNKLFVSHCTSARNHCYGCDGCGAMDEINAYDYFEIPGMPSGLQILKEEGPVTLTCISHDQMDKMVVVRANIVRNTAFPTCRTQVEMDVQGDIKDIDLAMDGRHWMMVYGDQSEKIKLANDMLGIETKIF